MAKVKTLTEKQLKAIELLTCGKGLTYKAIAEEVGVNPKTLWDWRKAPEFTHFQAEVQRVEEEKMLGLYDLARAKARELCEDKNQRMVEFVMKLAGHNPTQKIEADVTTDITISVEE